MACKTNKKVMFFSLNIHNPLIFNQVPCCYPEQPIRDKQSCSSDDKTFISTVVSVDILLIPKETRAAAADKVMPTFIFHLL